MRIAHVSYPHRSAVVPGLLRALRDAGNDVVEIDGTGPVELRGATVPALRNLLQAVRRFGREGHRLRWNTPLAFELHARHAGAQLEALPQLPDLVLQSGALFAPGLPPRLPYALILESTRRSEERHPAVPEAGLAAPVPLGTAWYEREAVLYRGARRIFTFSSVVRASLMEEYGVPADRAIVIGAGASVIPAHMERRQRGRRLVFVGTDWRSKGGTVLARAFARLRRSFPDVELDVIGPAQRPAELPVGARHHGFVPADRLSPFLERASIFVLPTLREPFGVAFLDAMAHGLPCVGTEVGAVPEILRHGETGLLVPPGDDAGLAYALGRLLANPERAARMGELGRTLVFARFNWPAVAHAVVDATVERAPAPAPRRRRTPKRPEHHPIESLPR